MIVVGILSCHFLVLSYPRISSFFTHQLSFGLQGLSEWRDVVARAEDESTGYILPNKTLLEIGTLQNC